MLELADQLELSSDQRTRLKSLFDAMKAKAVPLGAKLLDQAAALDQQFANHSIILENLKATTAQIGVTQAELRNAHPQYHWKRRRYWRTSKCSDRPCSEGTAHLPRSHQHHMQ